MERDKEHMDIDLFKRIVNLSRRERYPIMWLHHIGEPLMYNKLPEALEHFHKHGSGEGRISTNGVLLNDRNIDLLSKYAKYVLVCLDSADPKIYSEIRGPHFELVKANIQKLIDNSKCRIEIQYLMTNNNTEDKIENLFEMRDGVSIHYKGVGQFANTKDYRKKPIAPACSYLTHFIIARDGQVTMCCMDYDLNQPIGNIKENTFRELWQGAEAKRQKIVPMETLPVCKTCSCLPGAA
jgi:radical SAM protein with 4Fe4S-binding SPASM domain